jgi:hypothetical protein
MLFLTRVKAIASLALRVMFGAAMVLGATALPLKTAEAAGVLAVLADSVHQCIGPTCMDLQRWPDGRTVVTFSTPGGSQDAFNIRTRNGGQIEICGSCAWTLSTKVGKSYIFSAQGCLKGGLGGVLGSSCMSFSEFRYTAKPAPGLPLEPSVATGPGKALGRVGGQANAAPMPACQAAQLARTRNNAAAPALEAQCAAIMGQQIEAAAKTAPEVIGGSAGGQAADLTVVGLSGPTSLQAGLSGSYKITIKNVGSATATIEVAILFAKALDQTGQIIGDGLNCALSGHASAINAEITCTGGQLAAGESSTVTVQGRGQVPGGGMLVTSLNNSRSLIEGNYSNNVKQLNVTIN